MVLQVLEITDRVVVCLNLMDEARRKGLEWTPVPSPAISACQPSPITARTGEGIPALLSAIAEVIQGSIVTKPMRVEGTPEFQKADNELVPMIEQAAPGVPNARWLAIRLLDGDAKVQQALMSGELGQRVARQQRTDVQFSKKMSVQGRQ